MLDIFFVIIDYLHASKRCSRPSWEPRPQLQNVGFRDASKAARLHEVYQNLLLLERVEFGQVKVGVRWYTLILYGQCPHTYRFPSTTSHSESGRLSDLSRVSALDCKNEIESDQLTELPQLTQVRKRMLKTVYLPCQTCVLSPPSNREVRFCLFSRQELIN